MLEQNSGLASELGRMLDQARTDGLIAADGGVAIGGSVIADRGGVAAGRDIDGGQGGIHTGGPAPSA